MLMNMLVPSHTTSCTRSPRHVLTLKDHLTDFEQLHQALPGIVTVAAFQKSGQAFFIAEVQKFNNELLNIIE